MLSTGAASSHSTEKRIHDVRMPVDNKHKQVVPMEIPVAAKLPLGHSDTKNQSYAFPLLVILPLSNFRWRSTSPAEVALP